MAVNEHCGVGAKRIANGEHAIKPGTDACIDGRGCGVLGDNTIEGRELDGAIARRNRAPRCRRKSSRRALDATAIDVGVGGNRSP